MSQLEVTCGTCGSDINDDDEIASSNDNESCRDCYINDECPAQCNEEHGAPEQGGHRYPNEWTCPSTGETFYWMGDRRFGHGEWQQYETARIGSGEYVDVDETFICESCDVRYDNSEYEGDGYCSSCYRGMQDEDYNDDYEQSSGGTSSACCHARGCNATNVVAYHVLEEWVYCADHVRKMKRENARAIPEMVAA